MRVRAWVRVWVQAEVRRQQIPWRQSYRLHGWLWAAWCGFRKLSLGLCKGYLQPSAGFLEMHSWLLFRKLQQLQSCVAFCIRHVPVQGCSWWHFYKLLLGTEAVVCSSNISWAGEVCPISLPAPEADSRHRFGVQFTVYSLYQVLLGMVHTLACSKQWVLLTVWGLSYSHTLERSISVF